MIKKIVAGCVVFAATSLFGMSIDELNNVSKAELIQIKGIGETKALTVKTALSHHLI